MTSPALLSLADRVSNLTKACRETDYLICEAVHPFLAEQGYTRVAGDNGYHSSTPLLPGAEKVGPASDYTASLDAAMTLLVAGWEWEVTNLYGHAQVNLPLNSSERGWQSVSRKDDNAVLAFVECCLRARSALEANHG